jgi:hypothetical protein
MFAGVDGVYQICLQVPQHLVRASQVQNPGKKNSFEVSNELGLIKNPFEIPVRSHNGNSFTLENYLMLLFVKLFLRLNISLSLW